MTTPPLIGRGHVTIIKGEYPAARGMTTSPLFGRGHVTIIKGEYPAARGMTTSPGVPSTGDVYVAPDWARHLTTFKGEYPAALGMTTSPGVPSTGDYPAARGMTTSPLIGRGHTATFGIDVPRFAVLMTSPITFTGYLYVAPDRPRSCNDPQGRGTPRP
jgi:hypothetical protein